MADFLQNLNRWKDTLGRLNLEIPPVVIKYCTRQPNGVKRLGNRMAFCEMIKYAQLGNAFYARHEDHTCAVGPFVTGGPPPPLPYERGDFGAAIGAYNEPRAMRRRYDDLPKLAKDTIDCVAFSPLDKLAFEPDLLVLVTNNLEQTNTLLRALIYKSGEIYESKSTYVMACAWLYIYPYLTGKWNYVTTGLGMGMAARKVLPPGVQVISVPYDKLPVLLENLQDMPWVLPIEGENAKEYHDQVYADLGIPSEDEPPPFFWGK
jgi:uncharacterized protein (DUF169 family)